MKELELPRFYTFTRLLEIRSCLSFSGCVFLVLSYCSPYWLVSWEDTRSPFKNLGLWTACFHLFRHPKVQFDRLFHGCYPVWGNDLKIIAYWMVPGWMILIQVLTSLSLLISVSSQLFSISLVLRSPFKLVLRFERRMLLITAVLNTVSATLLLLFSRISAGVETTCSILTTTMSPGATPLPWQQLFALMHQLELWYKRGTLQLTDKTRTSPSSISCILI